MKLLRLFLVLAVALAVPLQGFAAVAAGQCMAFNHHGASMAQMHGAPDAHGDDHGPHGDHHDGAGHHADSASGQTADAEHCAPCVACCAATAIATPYQVIVPDFVRDAVVRLNGAFFSGIALEGLDRPPLTL